MKLDYTNFDRLLMQKIAGGATQFCDLQHGALLQMANGLAGLDSRGDVPGWRVIDRRLQALRKAGKLTYDRKAGWRVA